MAVDKLFKQMERRTERDLYRKTFTMARKSQKNLVSTIGEGAKASKWKKFAKEVFWFFMSLILGFLIGYMVFEIMGIAAPSWQSNLISYFGGDFWSLIYFLSLICFIGVYITRIFIWALNLLGK